MRAIKQGCIKFLNRKGEKFNWDNDNLSDLEVADKQSKLTDPGVADINVEEMYEDEDKPKKPTYVTRVVAARNADLDREQEPQTARGVAERANDKEDKVEDDQVNYNFEPVTAQNESPLGTGVNRKGVSLQHHGSNPVGYTCVPSFWRRIHLKEHNERSSWDLVSFLSVRVSISLCD